MKKSLILAAIAIGTLSSFTTKLNNTNNEEDAELKTWYYSCNDGTGHTGKFLSSSTTSHEDAVIIATRICADRKTVGIEP